MCGVAAWDCTAPVTALLLFLPPACPDPALGPWEAGMGRCRAGGVVRLFGGQAGVSHFYKGFPRCPQVAWCGCPPHRPLATSALSQPESSRVRSCEASSGAETVTSCPNRTGSSRHCSWLCDSLGAGSRGTATPTGTSLRWWWRRGAPLGADGVRWGAAPRAACREGEQCAGPEVSVVAAGASGGL